MRIVTERDLRRPEFMDASPEDLEFRTDGVLVRKDRWERGFRSIAYNVSNQAFEIDEVVAKVLQLVEDREEVRQEAAGWIWDALKHGRKL
jgi:hypothetical protein